MSDHDSKSGRGPQTGRPKAKAIRPRSSAGKRTLVEASRSGWASPTPTAAPNQSDTVQLRQSSAGAGPASDPAETEQWWSTALRPDLHSEPAQVEGDATRAAPEAEKGAGADSKAKLPGPAEPAGTEVVDAVPEADATSPEGVVTSPEGEQPPADGVAPESRAAKAESVRASGQLSHGGAVSGGAKGAKSQNVKPTDGSTFNGSAGANNCLPGDVTGASIGWDVVANPTTWGVNVTSFTTKGTINVAPWPSKPKSMETPNTANAVDGGNIQDKKGHDNDWRFAIKEMKEYHMASGGRSHYWHSYEASKAHEQKHWDLDWTVTCVGALWPTYNAKLDALTIPIAGAKDAAAARPLLQAKVNKICKEFDRKLTVAWNAIPDSPGLAGSNGYDAGQAVLNTLIAEVKAYAKKKSWKK